MRLSIIQRRFQTLYLLALRARGFLARALVRRWQERLGLAHYSCRLDPAHPLQITGPDGLPGTELVGVIVEGQAFRLVHTRPLREDDVVHELLHVLRPEWSHEEVEFWTDQLVAEPWLASIVAAESHRDDRLHALLTDVIDEYGTMGEEPGSRKELTAMRELTAFNLKTKKPCTILKPELVTLKNGRKAVRGVASDDGETTVVRILSPQAAKEWEQG